ncbi:CinA family protein [Prescottella agglutinans]|uniref:CinA family protein n=1 Tax=Prescottella agglutinans TaxID=1644129 RepID=UPI003D95F60E
MTGTRNDAGPASLAAAVAELAQKSGRRIATAESLTGGRISCLLGAAPNSSSWYRGSIVAYATEVKHALLQVPPGPVVSPRSARQMATSTADLLGADTVIAVTGAAGPASQDGHDPGTVWFGLYDRGTVSTEKKAFLGEPPDVVEQTAEHALELLARCIGARQ